MLVTLAVSFDRCHTIVFSLRRESCNGGLLLAAIAFAVVFNVPRYFELDVETKGNETYLVTTGK